MDALMNLPGQPLTMLSVEIAQLVELRHDNVRRTIETLAERGVITLPQFEEVPNDGPGPRTVKAYRVGKRDSYVVVAQLSPEFTARLVDRWQQLETAQAPTSLNLRDPRQMVAVALQLVEVNQELQAQLAAQRPAVEFHEAVADAVTLHSIEEVAKLYGYGRNAFFALLRSLGILLKSNLPAQDQLDARRFKVVEKTHKDGHGQVHLYQQTKVTGLGLQYLQQKLAAGPKSARALQPAEQNGAVL